MIRIHFKHDVSFIFCDKYLEQVLQTVAALSFDTLYLNQKRIFFCFSISWQILRDAKGGGQTLSIIKHALQFKHLNLKRVDNMSPEVTHPFWPTSLAYIVLSLSGVDVTR